MFHLSTIDMRRMLRFAQELNDAKTRDDDYLSKLPGDLNSLLEADRSVVCRIPGSAVQLATYVRKIEHARPSYVRKWSNTRCVVRSYAASSDFRNRTGHEILSIGRCYAANQIICAAFSRDRSRDAFSIAQLTLSHFAIGYALDSIGSVYSGMSAAYEVTDGNRRRRLREGDAALISGRIDRFLSDME